MQRLLLLFSLLLLLSPARAKVVINEIFYHAPDDLTDLQWVELHNPDPQPVNLAGWNFTKGIKFTFGDGVVLPAQGFLVLCKNRARFQEFYDVPVAGEFEKALKKSGERIELRDAAGELIDAVRFDDRAPWPIGADGMSASLERICLTAPGGVPANWAGSPLSDDGRRPGGTPGKPNTFTAAVVPPEISKVTFSPDRAQPGEPITVEAEVATDAGLKVVSLRYRVVGVGVEGDEIPLAMTNVLNRRYRATIPGQEAGQIVRFRIHAEDKTGTARFHPGENEPRPAFSCLVQTNIATGKIPFGYLVHTEPRLVANRQRRSAGPGPGGFNEDDQMRFMIGMQLGMAVDLPALWSAVTLTNAPANADLEPLRAAFTRLNREREQIEQRTLASTNLGATMQKLPELTKAFQGEVEKAVKPLLTGGQVAALDSWRSRPAGGQAFFGRNPEMMLRQVLPLEQAYLFLATRTNISATQLMAVRDLSRESVRERDGLINELRALMEEDGDREKFQDKVAALEGKVEARMKEILSAAQERQLGEWREQSRPPFMRGPGGRGGGAAPPQAVRGTSAFVYVDPKTQQPKLFDFVPIAERSGGWKVHFHRDRTLNGLTSINLIFERTERWVLSEPLAYEFYRQVGAAAPLTDFLRLWVDGEPAGYHLLIEQPNKSFLRRNGLRDDGDLYKLLWYENGVVAQHEKKTNPHTGHAELIQLLERLDQARTNPVVQWDVIKREFDVTQVITHYAVRMVLSDWDGYFNNYFTFHDVHGGGKWTLYPWDQDQTWGDPGGGQVSNMVIEMPLNFGAEGATPPGWQGGKPPTNFRGPMRGGPGWWRPGGWFSRPLLANPIFRQHFLACVKELLGSQFTESTIFPWIDRMHDQLQDEVRVRAGVFKDNPDASRERFDSNLASLKEFVTERRKWLLAQDEIRNAGAFDRTALH